MTSVLSAMNKFQSAGLERKPTYQEVINYITDDPDKIRYPDRRATIARNSHWLTQSDGFIDLDMQQQQEHQNEEQNALLREFADRFGLILANLEEFVNRHDLLIRRGGIPGPAGPAGPTGPRSYRSRRWDGSNRSNGWDGFNRSTRSNRTRWWEGSKRSNRSRRWDGSNRTNRTNRSIRMEKKKRSVN